MNYFLCIIFMISVAYSVTCGEDNANGAFCNHSRVSDPTKTNNTMNTNYDSDCCMESATANDNAKSCTAHHECDSYDFCDETGFCKLRENGVAEIAKLNALSCNDSCLGCKFWNSGSTEAKCDHVTTQEQCTRDKYIDYCEGEALDESELIALFISLSFVIVCSIAICVNLKTKDATKEEAKAELYTSCFYLLSMYDFISDFLMLIILWVVYLPEDGIELLRYVSLFSLLAAIIVGGYVLFSALKKWKEDPAISEWMGQNKCKVFLLWLFAGGSPIYGDVLAQTFGAPLSKSHTEGLNRHALLGLILENGPQIFVAVQLLNYKIAATDAGATFDNSAFPMTSILLSIATSIKNIYGACKSSKAGTEEVDGAGKAETEIAVVTEKNNKN